MDNIVPGSNAANMKKWAAEAPLAGNNPNYGKQMPGFGPGVIDYNQQQGTNYNMQGKLAGAMNQAHQNVANIPQPGAIQYTPFSMGIGKDAYAQTPAFNNNSLAHFSGLPVQAQQQGGAPPTAASANPANANARINSTPTMPTAGLIGGPRGSATAPKLSQFSNGQYPTPSPTAGMQVSPDTLMQWLHSNGLGGFNG